MLAERRRVAMSLMKKLQIKAESVDLQKCARFRAATSRRFKSVGWLAAGAQILILVDPTRGVDVRRSRAR